MTYIKSPLNYIGGKYKLLPQILPLFPKNINTFYDIFCGGCNVAINVDAQQIVCNDKLSPLIMFFRKIYHSFSDSNGLVKQVYEIINKYELSKENNEGYLKLRSDYNSGTRDSLMFYTLVAHSFSNQIRFNKKGDFNLPFGKRTFNKDLEQIFIDFVNELQSTKNTKFTNEDFRGFNLYDLHKNDFLYFDPPYLLSTASYNEQGGWIKKDEIDLLNLLDEIHNKGSRFALSNVLESKGKSNDILKEWSKKYNIHYLDYTYKNCNYQRKEKGNDSIEVLITNY